MLFKIEFKEHRNYIPHNLLYQYHEIRLPNGVTFPRKVVAISNTLRENDLQNNIEIIQAKPLFQKSLSAAFYTQKFKERKDGFIKQHGKTLLDFIDMTSKTENIWSALACTLIQKVNNQVSDHVRRIF